MVRYFLKLAYDGTDFHGWQRQPNATTIQQTIEEALSTLARRAVSIVGAGRTDTGVHALEMYAHMDWESSIADKNGLISSLNKLVGRQIVIKDIFPVSENAHARFDALSRTYLYRISLEKNPFNFRFAHRLERMPNLELMNEAAQILLSTDDFTSFAKLHSDVKTNICHVSKAEWTFEPVDNLLCFTIKADRFLRNMVRAVVGTLLNVGSGKLTIAGFNDVIARRDRCEAGMSVAAKGLFLTNVSYPDEIFCHEDRDKLIL